MDKSVSFHGYTLFSGDYDDCVACCQEWINDKGFRRILTLNPEIFMLGQADDSFKAWLQGADLTVPDGQGIVWAARQQGVPIYDVVTGVQLVHKLLNKGFSFYFIGTQTSVLERAIDHVKGAFPKSEVVGSFHGFFGVEEWSFIVSDIKEKRPDVILVGMGAEKQEQVIESLSVHLDHGIAIGVGGVLDVLGGAQTWAPVWVRSLKLEWFYRMVKQPFRFKKLHVLYRFVQLILADRFFQKRL